MNDPESSANSKTRWALWIPLGCLGAVVLCCGIPVAAIPWVFGVIKSSVPYQESLARVRADPRVRESLGAPIEPAFLVSGNINVTNGGGHAALSYDVSGPKGTATIIVNADKAGGEWTFNSLEVHPAGGREVINLIEPVPAENIPPEQPSEENGSTDDASTNE